MRALNLKEAAVFLKLHPTTLRQRAAVGRIPAARIGRRWVFLEEDLAAYVRKQYPDQWQALQGEIEEPCSRVAPRSGGNGRPPISQLSKPCPYQSHR